MRKIGFILMFFTALSHGGTRFQGSGEIVTPKLDVGSFTIELNVNNKNEVKGSYQYTKFNRPIYIAGHISGDNIDLLTENGQEQIIAILIKNEGNITSINGHWIYKGEKSKFTASSTQVSGICKRDNNCSPDLIEILKSKVKVEGDMELCSRFLNENLDYYYPDRNNEFHVSRIGSGDETIRVTPGSYLADINNDGKSERLVKFNVHSGRGGGCDHEWIQETNEKLSSVLQNELNKNLTPTSCRHYSDLFILDDKSYIENRAARKTARYLQVNSNLVQGLFLDLLSEVYEVTSNNVTKICAYEY